MKIFLFGGAETGQVRQELKMIEKVIKEAKPRQVLHIPFARTKTSEIEWQGDWFGRNINLASGVEYLNAQNRTHLAKARSPLVFISGGHQKLNLIKKVQASPRLQKLIKGAAVIIGESAGAAFLGEYLRTEGNVNSRKIARGLGLIKETIIEPHYIQRKRQGLLLEEMDRLGTRYGLGIDSVTALAFDSRQFPKRIKKLGRGRAEINRVIS